MHLEVLTEEKSQMSQAAALEAALANLLMADLPSGPDFHYNNTFAAFREPARDLKGEIRRLLVQLQGRFGSQQVDAEDLEDSEEGDGAFSEMVEGLLDDLLEKVDASLDRARAQLKAPSGKSADASAPAASGPATPSASQVAGKEAAADKRSRHAFAAAHTDVGFGPRPQDAFNPPVDNSNTPFRPKLGHWVRREEAHGGKAANALDAHAQRLGLVAADSEAAVHPLEAALNDLKYEDKQLEAPEPQLPQGLDETPLTYVDTLDGLKSLAQALSAVREVAVDLEAHSFRSFQGFCCLMQVSTRTADYLVDVIALRSHIGPHLAPMFADTKIVKVLHGSDSDIVWLQRDFGIYVASLFDTGQAARVLAYPSAGLAYLLSHFCSVKADKRWQLADWRVRPLSAEALHYARLDTHYLLYIYDCLKVELAKVPRVPDHLQEEVPERGPATCMGVVLERSRLLCLQRYEKELFSETSYLDAYRRCQEPLTREQLAVFAGLYAWRDRTARERDESTGFVLSRALLVKLAKRAPSNARDLRAVLGNNGRRTAPLLLDFASQVVEVIANARQQVDSVPDPDELRGDRRRPLSPAAALAARESAVDDAFAAVAAEEAAGGRTAKDEAAEPDIAADDATSRGDAALLPGSLGALPGAGLSRKGEGSLAGVRAAQAPPAQAAPLAAPLLPKKLPPLGGSARAGSGLGAMLASGPRQAGGLGALLGGRPQTVGSQAAVAAPKGDSAGGATAVAAAEPTDSRPVSTAVVATQGATAISAASFGIPSRASFGSVQTAEMVDMPSSGLGAAFGASSGKTPSGLGALLGGRRPPVVPGLKSTPSLAAAVTPADQAKKAAVEELKAHFALPFGLSPISADEPSEEQSAAQDDTPMPQAPAAPETPAPPGTPEEARAAQAASVREVMDQLRSENRFEVLQAGGSAAGAAHGGSLAPHGKAEEEQPEDYLPLPMSEQYRLPSKKARRGSGQALRAGGRHAGPSVQHDTARWQPERADQPSVTPQERERLRCAADVRATLEAVGLGEESAAHSAPALGHTKKKKKKNSKSLPAQLDAGELQPKAKKKSGQPAQHLHRSPAADAAAAVTEEQVVPFDFAAARASAMGLDVSGGIGGRDKGGRGGRGLRGGGRGGRGGRPGNDREGRDKGTKRKGFSPWDSIQEEAVKGGKRSAVMPRSGNRTMTFG